MGGEPEEVKWWGDSHMFPQEDEEDSACTTPLYVPSSKEDSSAAAKWFGDADDWFGAEEFVGVLRLPRAPRALRLKPLRLWLLRPAAQSYIAPAALQLSSVSRIPRPPLLGCPASQPLPCIDGGRAVAAAPAAVRWR